ncbi:MAG TPA: sulfotransferase [Acidimicrobiia bacterium]|nr:sulfotransferase [Acidimicrobiia bacterium]
MILIIGMSRSGTTFVGRLLESRPDVHLETEPHMVWKAGSFSHLPDDVVEDDARAASWIRQTLLDAAAEKTLVEKSPVNCLRPDLVHRVFPDARVVYVERDPARCIDSNYRRTLNHESLKPSIAIRKYLTPRRAEGDFGEHLDATGGRSLLKQVRPRDWPAFVAYTARLLWTRQTKGPLPFGPKMAGFVEIVRRDGPLAYHVEVLRVAQERKTRFVELYGDRLASFRLETLQTDPGEIARLFTFCGFPTDRIDALVGGFDRDLVSRASRPGPHDEEIHRLMKTQGVT